MCRPDVFLIIMAKKSFFMKGFSQHHGKWFPHHGNFTHSFSSRQFHRLNLLECVLLASSQISVSFVLVPMANFNKKKFEA